jgi:hypothetical protein
VTGAIISKLLRHETQFYLCVISRLWRLSPKLLGYDGMYETMALRARDFLRRFPL